MTFQTLCLFLPELLFLTNTLLVLFWGLSFDVNPHHDKKLLLLWNAQIRCAISLFGFFSVGIQWCFFNQYNCSLNTLLSFSNGLLGLNLINLQRKILILLLGVIFLLVFYNTRWKQSSSLPFEQVFLYARIRWARLILVAAQDFIVIYVAVELQALLTYVLAVITTTSSRFSIEGGLKYFIVGGFVSGLLLYGISLFYLATGDTSLECASVLICSHLKTEKPYIYLFTAGILRVRVSLLVKLGAAPFHRWLPDVYEGSPLITTFFFSFLTKLGYLGFFFRLRQEIIGAHFELFQLHLSCAALITRVIGSLGALAQRKLKRFFAYSTIIHTGFLRAARATGTPEGLQARLRYLLCYLVSLLGVFSLLLSLYHLPDETPLTYRNQLSFLSGANLVLKLGFSLLLFSLAGIPFLAGFFTKFLVFVSVWNAKMYWLTTCALFSTVLTCFYYLRLIKSLLFDRSGRYQKVRYSCTLDANGLGFFFIFSVLFSLFFRLFIPSFFYRGMYWF